MARADGGTVIFVLDASGSMEMGFYHCFNPIKEPETLFESTGSPPELKLLTMPSVGQGPVRPLPLRPMFVAAADSRIARAREIIARLSHEYEERGFRTGLVVFGHTGGRNDGCEAVETLVEPAAGAATIVTNQANSISPFGVTPLARAMIFAGKALERESGAGPRQLVVVTDGGENCGGDPVEAALALNKQFGVHVHIIGLDLCGRERAAAQEIAKITGGTFSEDQASGDFVEKALAAAPASSPASSAAPPGAVPWVPASRKGPPAPAPGSAPSPAKAPPPEPIKQGGAGEVSIEGPADAVPPPPVLIMPKDLGGAEDGAPIQKK